VSQRALTAPARPRALPGATNGHRPDDVAIMVAERARPRVRVWWLWTAGAIALLVGSGAVVIWARTLPSFDAYGWLTWGQRTWHGGLDTNAAPSWKPLPYLFTVIYAVLGHHAELRLWMTTSAAVAFAGVVFAGRIAYKLTAPRAERRWAGWVAAAFAGLALLALRDELHYGYLHYALSSQSDPMIVTFVLAAIDLALSGRRRAAFACGVLASLGRPEAWPFLALCSVWLWRRERADRWLVAGAWVLLLALWFGIPAISSRTPFVSAANALDSGRAPSGDRVTAVLSRFGELQHWPVYVAAALCVALAALRRSSARDHAALALAGGIVVWLAIEIAFGLHGWPALGRYMFEPAAVATVLAGAFAGRLLAADWRGIASVGAVRRAIGSASEPDTVVPLRIREVWRSSPTPPAENAKLPGGAGNDRAGQGRASRRRARGGGAGRGDGPRSRLGRAQRALGPDPPTRPDCGDRGVAGRCRPARRRRAAARLRRTVDASAVPDGARVRARRQRQPGRLQVLPGARPRQPGAVRHPVRVRGRLAGPGRASDRPRVRAAADFAREPLSLRVRRRSAAAARRLRASPAAAFGHPGASVARISAASGCSVLPTTSLKQSN
jgi:hypothetical protein